MIRGIIFIFIPYSPSKAPLSPNSAERRPNTWTDPNPSAKGNGHAAAGSSLPLLRLGLGEEEGLELEVGVMRQGREKGEVR